nr:hypothetical protein [Tanacetum cinerariifolium]
KKQDTVAKPSDKSDSNTHIHVVTIKPQKTNVPVPPSTGVKSCPNASGSQPKRNPKTNRISPAKGVNKLPVEDHPRTTKSHLRTLNRVDSSSRLKNSMDAHLDYLRHLKKSVETIRDIVEEAKVVRPLDSSIVSACRYTKHSQELIEYAIGTCPQGSQQRAKRLAHIPLIRKKQDTVAKPSDQSDSNTHIHVVTIKPQKTNVPVPPSTGVKSCPNASGSEPKRNPKTNRISPAKGVNKLPVEDHPRTTKSHLRTLNRVDSSSRLKCT